MKLNRSKLRKIILSEIKRLNEGISLPDPSGLPPLQDNEFDSAIEDQQDFLRGLHQRPASVQLGKGHSRPDYDSFLSSIGAKEISRNQAKSLTDSMPYDGQTKNIELELQSKLSSVFNLAITQSEFLQYVQPRKDFDHKGRPILVSMGADDTAVVFKHAQGNPLGGPPKYYLYSN